MDDEPYNMVRSLELQIAGAINNWSGLNQPPHVTVKRPFRVSNFQQLQKVITAFDSIAAETAAFNIYYDNIDFFGQNVLFLKVRENNQLQQLHANMLASMEAVVPGAMQPKEGEEMVFHTSLALSLNELEFTSSKVLGRDLSVGLLPLQVPIKQIGVFFSTDNEHWVIIRNKQLAGS